MLKLLPNPLMPARVVSTLNIETLKSPMVFRRTKPTTKKIIRRLTRKENAKQSLGALQPGHDVFGFTKGQFSLLDLIAEINDQLGPFHLILSTWTAANADLDHVHVFLKNQALLSARFILDFTFQRRQPAVAQKIRDVFGAQNIRVTRTHAKFAILYNDKIKLVLKTSMNLNTNPRFEDFEISYDEELFEFLKTVCEEIFSDGRDQGAMGSQQLAKQFSEKT